MLTAGQAAAYKGDAPRVGPAETEIETMPRFSIQTITVNDCTETRAYFSVRAVFTDGREAWAHRRGAHHPVEGFYRDTRSRLAVGRMAAIEAALPAALDAFLRAQAEKEGLRRQAELKARLLAAKRAREAQARWEAEMEAERLAELSDDEREIEELEALRAAIGASMGDLFAGTQVSA